MSEANKALARHSWEVVVDNPDILGEVHAADLVWHENPPKKSRA